MRDFFTKVVWKSTGSILFAGIIASILTAIVHSIIYNFQGYMVYPTKYTTLQIAERPIVTEIDFVAIYCGALAGFVIGRLREKTARKVLKDAGVEFVDE